MNRKERRIRRRDRQRPAKMARALGDACQRAIKAVNKFNHVMRGIAIP